MPTWGCMTSNSYTETVYCMHTECKRIIIESTYMCHKDIHGSMDPWACIRLQRQFFDCW